MAERPTTMMLEMCGTQFEVPFDPTPEDVARAINEQSNAFYAEVVGHNIKIEMLCPQVVAAPQIVVATTAAEVRNRKARRAAVSRARKVSRTRNR